MLRQGEKYVKFYRCVLVGYKSRHVNIKIIMMYPIQIPSRMKKINNYNYSNITV
jgi:hypothetical protein